MYYNKSKYRKCNKYSSSWSDKKRQKWTMKGGELFNVKVYITHKNNIYVTTFFSTCPPVVLGMTEIEAISTYVWVVMNTSTQT